MDRVKSGTSQTLLISVGMTLIISAREGKSEVTDYEYFGRGHKISDPPFLLMAERDPGF